MLALSETENKRKLEIGDSDDFGLEKKRQTLAPTPAVEPMTITMDCPAASVGAIIGKKGANVHEIMKRSGCKIVIDQSDQRDGAPKRVNLTGPPDKLAVAMALVSLIIKDGANALFGGGDADGTGVSKVAPLQSESRCPKNKVGEVIGQRGVTIAEIMRRSGCRVHIIQEAPSDGKTDEREVIYNGSLEQMNEAKVLVQSVINEGASILGIIAGGSSSAGGGSNYTPTGDTAAIVLEDDIDPEKVGAVIGTKGQCISEIMKRSGCRIVINQAFPKGEKHRISFSGQRDQIETARSMVRVVIEKGPTGIAEYGNTMTVEEMDIVQRQTGRVLGPQGSTIKEMQIRFGVKLNIQVSEAAKGGDAEAINKLKLTGSMDAVKLSRTCVQHILSGGTVESFQTPMNMFGGQQMMQQNQQFNMPPMQNQQFNQQPQYGQPQFNNQPQYGYPPAMTNTGYGQPPMQQPPMQQQQPPMQQQQQQPPQYGGPMGQPQQQNYGAPSPNYGAPQQQPQQQAPPAAAPAPQGASLGLGADGTSGILEPPSPQPDGSHQQIANLRTDVLGKIIGKAGVNISLIKQKSGANVSVLKDTVPNTTGYTKVIMVGAAADVYLATQMIQEILVNGPSKLSSLPDKPQSGAPGYPQIAQPAAYKAPSAYPNYSEAAAPQYAAQPQYATQPQYAAQTQGAPLGQQQYQQAAAAPQQYQQPVQTPQFQAQPQYAAAPLGQTPQGAQPGAGQFYAQYQQPR